MEKTINQEFENKNIAILGFGREGRSTLNYIVKNISNCNLCILDQNEIDISEYVKNIGDKGHIKITKQSGKNYLFNLEKFDLIIKSPGVSLKNIDIEEIKEKITSQTEIFLKYYKNKVIGVTGTKGKSTTSTLIYEMLKRKYSSMLIGNIGTPCFEALENIKNIEYIVFELSAHQLELVKYSPHIAIFLNIYEEHLDYYKSYEAYLEAKQNIFKYQNKNDIYICNKEQEKLLNNGFKLQQKTYKVSSNIIKETFEYFGQSINTLIGKHNIYNMKVAIKVAKILEVSNNDILAALKNFKSLPHRLECFKNVEGIRYIDDSISTIPQTTISAIESIKKIGTLLVGGMNRNVDYMPFVEYIKEVDLNKKKNIEILNIIFMYDTGKIIYDEIKKDKLKNINIFYVEDLDKAVLQAEKLNKSGYACVLSPAAASYGFFKNFEERGDKFKKLTNM